MGNSTAVLSNAEISAFRQDGFVVPSYRLPPDVLARLQRLARKLVDDNPQLGDEPMTSPHVPGSGLQNLKSNPGWIEFPTYPSILDMVEQLTGPDLILWGTTVFSKPASEGRRFAWHRDGRYWPIKPLATTSVWIAVEDCTVENGCLRMLPGSHLARDIGRHYRSTSDDVATPETLVDDEVNEAIAQDILLEAGQIVLFDVYTAHSSYPNRSDRPRIGYALRYMPSTSHYDHHDVPVADSRGAGHHTRPLVLVRGADRSGKNDFSIGHPAKAA